MTRNTGTFIIALLSLIAFNSTTSAKVKRFGPVMSIRPITIKNVAYSTSGRFIAVPNFITAGSVGVFKVSQSGNIVNVPARLSERNFYRAAGVFYFSTKDTSVDLIYILLPELLSGYSVSFSPIGDTLAIAGGDKVFIYSAGYRWKLEKTITLAQNTTRAVFSPDGSKLAVISQGKIYCLELKSGSTLYTIEPQGSNKFTDLSFSNNGSLLAAYEYQDIVLEHTSRIRIFQSVNGDIDRDLPWFTDKPAKVPGDHLPLVSFAPGDTALAVTIEKGFAGKIFLVKEVDGSLIRTFKGYCHAFSPDGSLFTAGGKVYSTKGWSEIGNFSNSANNAAFSPTERVIIATMPEEISRYRIED